MNQATAHQDLLRGIVWHAMIDRGQLPDFGAAVLAETASIRSVERRFLDFAWVVS